MSTASPPVIKPLSADDSQSVLARNHMGRLVFCAKGEVEIRPLNYVFAKKAIYGRTSPTALIATESPRRVAFEVDEIQSRYSWTSVIARGELKLLTASNSDEETRDQAVNLLRRIVKQALLPDDPMPERNLVFRIEVDEVTGMTCS